MRFTKMHGAGNDYVYVDGFRDELPPDPSATAIEISNRHTGIGADGLVLICQSDIADAEMRMFNADGSEAEMCGNGIRCVAKYLHDHGIVEKEKIMIATGDGIKTLDVFVEGGKVTSVRVDMGVPKLAATEIPTLIEENASQVVNAAIEVDGKQLRVTCVSMGNPHCVIFVDELSIDPISTSEMDDLVLRLGPEIETDPRFPDRTNVEFVTVISPAEVRQRTWERGSGETMACGTGASAVCVAGVLVGRTERRLTCHLLGGTLQLDWDEASNHVFMTGPAQEVFRGEFG